MEPRRNEFDQPIGAAIDWTPPPFPPHQALTGRTVALEPLGHDHADGLMAAFTDDDGRMWTYLQWGPFTTASELIEVVDRIDEQPDSLGHAIVVDGAPVGIACYLRIVPTHGVIEIGGISMAPSLQRTTASTEALWLLADRAFALGYRRLEWKCDSLNGPSRAAAERLGFTYEGTFRQAIVYKQRNRDTAWFAITDDEWPPIDAAIRSWLDPTNFDETGGQRQRLRDLLGGTANP